MESNQGYTGQPFYASGRGGVTVKLRAFSGWGKAVLKISGARAAIFWGWACIPGVGDNGTAKMLVMMCG